jgi:hypothetical protein
MVSQARRPAASESAQAGSSSARASLETPRDAVTVSDQARQLAATAQGSQPAKGQDDPRLQLDFRKLRELAFPDPSKPAAASEE